MLYLLLHFGLSGIALTCTACVLECAFALTTALLVLYLLLYLHCVYAGVRICSTYCFTSTLRTALLVLYVLLYFYCFTSEEYAYALLTALLQSY
jgi:hypothetical protein